MSFFERLSMLLKQKNISGAQMSLQLGFSSGLFSQWKTGQMPSPKNLQKIANYFNVSVDYLLTGDESKETLLGSLAHYARNIAMAREMNELTQDELAEKMNCDVQTIKDMEEGTIVPDSSELQKLSEILRVSERNLLGLTSEEAKKNPNYLFLKENKIPRKIDPEQEKIDNKRFEEIKAKIGARAQADIDFVHGMAEQSEKDEAFRILYDEYLNARGRNKIYRFAEDLIENPSNLVSGIKPIQTDNSMDKKSDETASENKEGEPNADKQDE